MNVQQVLCQPTRDWQAKAPASEAEIRLLEWRKATFSLLRERSSIGYIFALSPLGLCSEMLQLQQGFRFVSESSSKEELPFGIVVARTQSIEQDSIDRTVIELLNLSRRFDGDYDGSETPIVTQ
jgi:hypothetical protein